MKKIFLFTTIAFLMLSSCKKEATTLLQDQTVSDSEFQANASSSQTETNASTSEGAFTFHDDFVLNWEGTQLYNPCTNELMTLSGDTYVTVHGIYNGAKSTMTVHANGQQIKAVGESGRLYTISGSTNHQESSFSDGVFTTKEVHFDRFITTGSENTLIWKDNFYIKVDANGNVTIIRDEIHETYCQ